MEQIQGQTKASYGASAEGIPMHVNESTAELRHGRTRDVAFSARSSDLPPLVSIQKTGNINTKD
jgi:hypothetical protein